MLLVTDFGEKVINFFIYKAKIGENQAI